MYVAELYATAIFFFFDNLWPSKTHGPITSINDLDKMIPSDEHGLYLIYAKGTPKENIRYPLYIGVTGGRDFRTRFKNNFKAPGVLDKLLKSKSVNLRAHKVYALTVKQPSITANFFLSVFLKSFNFALNTEENEPERQTLEFGQKQAPFEQGLKILKDSFGSLKTILNNEQNAFLGEVAKGNSVVHDKSNILNNGKSKNNQTSDQLGLML